MSLGNCNDEPEAQERGRAWREEGEKGKESDSEPPTGSWEGGGRDLGLAFPPLPSPALRVCLLPTTLISPKVAAASWALCQLLEPAQLCSCFFLRPTQ